MSQVATTITEAEQIVGAVERSLADPASKTDERKAAAAELFYKAGSATARAVREIYEAVELDPPQGFSIGNHQAHDLCIASKLPSSAASRSIEFPSLSSRR
jgi:hypothetical protein